MRAGAKHRLRLFETAPSRMSQFDGSRLSCEELQMLLNGRNFDLVGT